METYVFFRIHPETNLEMFYPVDLKDDDDAVANAEANPGTLRVETVEGREVWNANKH